MVIGGLVVFRHLVGRAGGGRINHKGHEGSLRGRRLGGYDVGGGEMQRCFAALSMTSRLASG
jgi:hypothetical protein